MIKKFVELFAIIMGAGIIPVIWILQGLGLLDLTGTEIIGATIVGETLILQFFFRKKESGEPNGK